MSTSLSDLTHRARLRLLQMHFDSQVGHIGGNLSALDALMVLHHRVMGPDDRFVLSKGHSAGALYIALWTLGVLSDEDLDTFHGEGTMLPGHPPAMGIDRIHFATGSLGHGLSIAAGTALAARFQSVNRCVYCLTSDGEWEEGSTWEALIFAVHHRLDNLSILIDCNRLQGFGTTSEVASLDPLEEKLGGFGIETVALDGHDLTAMETALCKKGSGPRVFILNTHKGEGVSFMRDRLEWHYLPLNSDQYRDAVAELCAAKE